MTGAAPTPLECVRALCLALPEVTEHLSHGEPAWFVRGSRPFATLADDHHSDGRPAVWCAAPPGAQEELVESEPRHYFVPPYVGGRGWLGVRLDTGLDWERVAEALAAAHLFRAPARGARLGRGSSPGRRPR